MIEGRIFENSSGAVKTMRAKMRMGRHAVTAIITIGIAAMLAAAAFLPPEVMTQMLGGVSSKFLDNTVHASAPPTTWTVCASGCNFTTIGGALADVSVVNGDTIDVGPGTYNESLTITKEVTLLGEQANVEPDAASRVGNESIIDSVSPIIVQANNVTINGFELANFDYAIDSEGDYDYLTIKYNRMDHGGSSVAILFGWSGHLATPPVVEHVTITHNLITGQNDAGIAMVGGDDDGTNGPDALFAWIEISNNIIGQINAPALWAGMSPDDYTIDHFKLNGNYLHDNDFNCFIGNILFGEMKDNLIAGSPCYIGMQAAVISGNSFVKNTDVATLQLFGLYSGYTGLYFLRPTGNVVVTNNEFTNEVSGRGLLILPDNPTTDNILVTTNAFRDSGVGTNSSGFSDCFLNDPTGWILVNYGNCASDGTPDIRSQYLHADNNWWGGQDGTSDNSGGLFGKITTDSWMSYYTDDPAKQVAPANWPLKDEMLVNPGFWPINARYRAVFTETTDPRTIDLDDAYLGAPSLTVAGIGTGGAFFQFSATSQPSGEPPFKVTAGTVFLNVAVLSGNVVYPAQLCIYGEPGYELYHYVSGEWVKVSKTQVDNIICSEDLTELGIFTVAQPKDAVAIQYTGDTYIETSGTTVHLAAKLTGASACLEGQTVYFVNDLNGNGMADGGEPVLGSGTTNEYGAATASFMGATGIYEIVLYVEENTQCLGAVNTATIVVAGTGYASTGGGWYTNSGRVNFGYVVNVKRTQSSLIAKGQMLWSMQGKTRLKGIVNGYTQIDCPTQTDPVLSPPTRCAYITGYGDLFTWDSDQEMWVLLMSNVGYQVTVGDGGGMSGKRGGSNVFPDFFRMNIPTQVVLGESVKLLQLKGGNIVVK